MFVSRGEKSLIFLSGNYRVFPNVQLFLALETDIGYRLQFFSPDWDTKIKALWGHIILA